MISIHTWVYEDGDVHISVDVERRRNALGRKPTLSAAEKVALLSMIAEELCDRFPDADANRPDNGTTRIAFQHQSDARSLTDIRQETAVDWDRAKFNPFVPTRT